MSQHPWLSCYLKEIQINFRGLPVELRSLGDAYVRDEFKRHKDADVDFIPVFMTEWTVSITLLRCNSYRNAG